MLMLRLARVYPHKIRKVFGGTPHWLREASGAIKLPILLRFALTVQVMAFAPNHFFKTIPAILSGKKRMYLTPIQFVTNIAVIQIFIWAFIEPEIASVDKAIVVTANLGLVIITPALMIVACLSMIALWFICTSIWPFGWLVRELDIRYNYHSLIIPISIDTYKALEWSRYFWSLTYCYLYFYLISGMLGTFFLGGESIIIGLYSIVGQGIVHINRFTIIPLGLAGVLFFALGFKLIINPYVELLIHCATRPTLRIMRYVAFKTSRYY